MLFYKLLIEAVYFIQILLNKIFLTYAFFICTDLKKIKKFFLYESKSEKDDLALFETIAIKDSILANLITAKALLRKEKIKLKCFNMTINSFYNPNVKFNYNSMNMESINYYLKDLEDLNNAYKIYKQYYFQLKTKRDLYNLKIQKIYIGDLVYDGYIRFYKKPTVDLNTFSFKYYFFKCCISFIFWQKYIKENKVKYIFLSHANYLIGMPLRVGIYNNVKVYSITSTYLNKFSKKKLYNGLEYLDYKKEFNKIPKLKKKLILKKSKKLLNERFQDNLKIRGLFDTPITKENPFSSKEVKNIFHKNQRIKILVAAHDLFDAPNSRGGMTFLDFYEWLVYLRDHNVSKKYDWYIKMHPDAYKGNDEELHKIFKDKKNFYFLDKDVNHFQIIKNKIDVVFSCKGTVGFEYPYFSIPVILASNNSKVGQYKFAYQAKNLKEYNQMLNNLETYLNKFKKNINELAEFFFTNYFIFNTNDWLIKNYEKKKNIKFRRNAAGASRFNPSIIKEELDILIKDKKLADEKIELIYKFIKGNKYMYLKPLNKVVNTFLNN